MKNIMKPPTRVRSPTKKSPSGYSILLLVPEFALSDEHQACVVVFSSSIPANVDFYVKFMSSVKNTFVRAERVNDTTLSFFSPVNFPIGEVKLSIHHGAGHTILCNYSRTFTFKSKCEVVHELLQTTSDPMSFISSAYNMNEKDSVAIDFKLERAFRMNIPQNFNILQSNNKQKSNPDPTSVKNPTLLHFAARYNLVRLCLALLNSPGGQEALTRLNSDGYTPSQLAEICGNSHLSQLLNDTGNNNKQNDSQSDAADEIYEHMSPEVYDRYIEVKKDCEIYEDMNGTESYNELYEDMYECRRESANNRASALADNQSVYSSDSAVSSASCDSRGSGGGDVGYAPPLVPPSDYKKAQPVTSNPLLNELKRKTEQRNSIVLDEIFDVRPQTPPPIQRRQHGQYANPPFAPSVVQREGIQRPTPPPVPVRSSADMHASPSPRTSTGTVEDEIYDVLPSNGSTDEEIYDIPPDRSSSDNLQASDPNECYDTPPSRTSYQQEQNESFDEVYDVPPPTSEWQQPGSESEFYDIPPGRLLTQLSEGFETYDIPPSQNSFSYEEGDALYDAISPLSKPTYNSSNQDISLAPRSPGRRNIPDLGRICKRYSEPAISVSVLEHQRLSKSSAVGRPVLPPPRNNNSPQPPMLQRRPMPPPPPPHRR